MTLTLRDDKVKSRQSYHMLALYPLEDRHRQALVMYDLLGLPYKEIAEAMGVSSITVGQYVHEARMQMGWPSVSMQPRRLA